MRVLVLAGVLVVSGASTSDAQTFIGTVCWGYDGYSNVLRTGLTRMPDGSYTMTAHLTTPGTPFEFVGTGTARPSALEANTYVMTYTVAGMWGPVPSMTTGVAKLAMPFLAGSWNHLSVQPAPWNTSATTGPSIHMIACPASDVLDPSDTRPSILAELFKK